jgi:hypothetical protein
MLVSLTSVELSLLNIFWGVTFSFLGISFLLCLAIVLRRTWKNWRATQSAAQKRKFELFLAAALKQDFASDYDLSQAPKCQTPEMARVLLHYFRTLKGDKLEKLKEMISDSKWEDDLLKGSSEHIRGIRMRCLRTLSYLESQGSLQVIFNNLSSEDKYVRLTAAQCLVRRQSFCYFGPIIESIREAFPKDPRILAGVLAKFGTPSVASLESYISRTDDGTAKVACLEALILIMPAKTRLDLEDLMADDSEAVRAAALSLSAIADFDNEIDPLRLGLQDDAISVKIRAAKMACDVKRTDITTELYKLTREPVMWVRYWALRAIWTSGESGQKFVNSLARSQEMAEKVALEMRFGYV